MSGKYWNASWNPVVGCEKCSEGCLNCWAERMAWRMHGAWRARQLSATRNPFDVYASVVQEGMWTGLMAIDSERMNAPVHWIRPRVIATCWMGDLYREATPPFVFDAVYRIIRRASWHVYLLLTKRPSSMSYVAHGHVVEMVGGGEIWYGNTASSRRDLDWLHRVAPGKGSHYWVSLEPVLERMRGVKLAMKCVSPECVIAGAETGPGARPAEDDWFREIRDACGELGIPFFLKQLSGGGRVLDGREHNDLPWRRYL